MLGGADAQDAGVTAKLHVCEMAPVLVVTGPRGVGRRS